MTDNLHYFNKTSIMSKNEREESDQKVVRQVDGKMEQLK